MSLAPVIALSHGGGPMPLLGDPNHKDIVSSLRNRVPSILSLRNSTSSTSTSTQAATRPRAIVLITAHWSTGRPTISAGKSPSLLYDYGGFPKEAYNLSFPAPGSPEVAQKVFSAMKAEGLNPKLDETRDWDHGVFVPMLLVNPEADVPIVQISVLESEDPEEHIRMGKALRSLREDNIAIVGSGFATYHNFRYMRQLMAASPGSDTRTRVLKQNNEWSQRLTDAVTDPDEDLRRKKLVGWRDLPFADEMHPPGAGEHFMPLLVCAGAAGETDGKGKFYKDEFLGLDIHTYYWAANEVK